MAPSEDRPRGWPEVHAARVPMSQVERERLSQRPGLIVVYRERRAAWIQKSADLRATFTTLFAAQGPAALSPLRRSIAGFLGVSTPVAIASGRYRPTAEDHARISRWLRDCTLAAIDCENEAAALALESRLLAAPEAERIAAGDEPHAHVHAAPGDAAHLGG